LIQTATIKSTNVIKTRLFQRLTFLQPSRHASKRWTTQSNVLATDTPSGIQYDDCEEVEVVVTPATVDCGVSIETDITVQATDACGNMED
jgi:hypothetical protein